METKIPQVRVRDKHQITLPASVMRAANIGKDSILCVGYENGIITLTTRQALDTKKSSLLSLAGSTKGLYGKTTADRQQYIASERESWKK